MISFGKVHVAFDEDDYGRCAGIALIKDGPSGERQVLNAEGDWIEIPPDKRINDVCGPTLKFNAGYGHLRGDDVLQAFMDGLWEKGMRPKERRHEMEIALFQDKLKLQDSHLQDMRRLVFEKPETIITHEERP